MPHQCTTCGHVFPDGSKEMLSGCPDCGGNKFQFHAGEIPDEAAPGGDASPGGSTDSVVASAVGKATDTLRDFVADRARPDAPTDRSGDGPARDRPAAGARPGDAGPAGPGPDGADAPETTQATLDSLTAGREDADADDGPSNDAERSDDATLADDVAEKWPSVGTEAGVESGERDRPTDAGEWPDPWESDGEDGDGSPAPAGSVDAADELAAETATDGPDADATSGPSDATAGHDAETVEAAGGENSAQADARTAMVGADELPDGSTDGRAVDEPSADRPGLAELREELNDQFESIRVVAPGQYELNLMELYDREEYIIAIQENGRYVIEVPDTWDGPEEA